MVEGAKIFLDVDNLEDIGKLEAYIQGSDVVLVLLTRDYLSSKNCRRELVETFRIEKPLLLVVETDPGKGAVSLLSLETEMVPGLDRAPDEPKGALRSPRRPTVWSPSLVSWVPHLDSRCDFRPLSEPLHFI